MPSPNWTQRALASLMATDPAGSDPTIPQPGFLTGPSGFVVVPAGSGFGITLHASTWVIAGGAPATTGSVLWCPAGDVSKTVAAADPTNPRHDLVTLQVTDPGSSSTAGSSDVVIVQGTPASSPADPTAPTGALVIARVNVRAAATTIVQNDITDLRLQIGLRDIQPNPRWEISGLGGSHSIANNTETAARLGTIVEATNVTAVANPASATIQIPGGYDLGFNALFLAGGSVGLRQAIINITRGASVIRRMKGGSGAENGLIWMRAQGAIRLNAGDVITATVLQQSGGTISLDDTDLITQFTGTWTGP